MDIKTDFIPKNGDRIRIPSRFNGYMRWYEFVVCPNCGLGRWIADNIVKRVCFTGKCKACHDKNIKDYLPRGSDASNWQGGKTKRRGYVWVRIEETNPFFIMHGVKKHKGRNWGYIMEHRLVMAQHLGRCLESWELVHHINGIKDDNRLENLKLVTSVKEHVMTPIIELQSLRARVADLESRNTQLEAEITLLRAQLEKDGVTNDQNV